METWQIRDILEWSAKYFKKKHIDQPRLTSEILLAHSLKCRRIDLYLNYDRPLNQPDRDRYREMLKSRAKGKPWQYIVGETEFYSLPFRVNDAVLIPRPETEILIDAVLDHCKKNEPYKIWDIGSGSGAIAISLAKNLPLAKILATDISDQAIKIAKKNAELNHVGERICFRQSDLAKNVEETRFDLIVSNPPYIATSEFSSLPIEVRHEPVTALNGGKDGLYFYRRFAKICQIHLASRGALAVEIGADQGERVREILKRSAIFYSVEILKDYARRDRVIYAKKI